MRFRLGWQCDPFAWHGVRTGYEEVEAEDMVEACILARIAAAQRLMVTKGMVHITTGTTLPETV